MRSINPEVFKSFMPGQLVRVLSSPGTDRSGELGVIISEPIVIVENSIFYDVMLVDGLDFLRYNWLEAVDEAG